MVAICTLTRYPDIFERFAGSVEKFHSPEIPKLVITSGGRRIWRRGWISLSGREPFCFAQNANIGLKAWPENYDVLLCNDDTEFTSETAEALAGLAQRFPDVGLISPRIEGGVNNAICKNPDPWRILQTSPEYIPFVCVLIPARTIEHVGLLDERFKGYGGEDVDYCKRIQAAGLKLAVAPRIRVKHGFGDKTHSSSFLRVMSERERAESMAGTTKQLEDKWNRS